MATIDISTTGTAGPLTTALGGPGIGILLSLPPAPPCPECPPFPPTPLAPVTQANPLPQALPAGVDFGFDVDATFGLNPFLPLVSGLANLGQELLHRLSTPRGSLPYDADYGYDLRELLNETMTSAAIRTTSSS